MTISILGLSSFTALKVVDATRDRQLDLLRNEPGHARSEEAFRERIAEISTPEEFVKDYEVYSFVMRAFGLEDQIFGKGMIRKILSSDPAEDNSLVNRLTDSRFKELHAAMGFVTAEETPPVDFGDPAWVQAMVNRYYDRTFINGNDEQNETVGAVLEFRDKAEGLTNWFQVLKDKSLTRFFQVALGLPKELSALEVDDQARRLGDRFDLTKLSDPEERERLITRFIAISDALDPPDGVGPTAALSMLQSSGSASQIISITADLSKITVSAASLYR